MKYILGIAVIASGLCFVSACKKSSGGVKSMLEARWKSEEVGEDKNGNGILDSSEMHSVDSLNEYVLFNADGTGSDIGANFGNYPIPFYWALSQNNQYLGIQDTSNNVVYYHIDALTNTQLILRDTSGGTNGWNIYKKD
jgi:hypothetical protein